MNLILLIFILALLFIIINVLTLTSETFSVWPNDIDKKILENKIDTSYIPGLEFMSKEYIPLKDLLMLSDKKVDYPKIEQVSFRELMATDVGLHRMVSKIIVGVLNSLNDEKTSNIISNPHSNITVKNISPYSVSFGGIRDPTKKDKLNSNDFRIFEQRLIEEDKYAKFDKEGIIDKDYINWMNFIYSTMNTNLPETKEIDNKIIKKIKNIEVHVWRAFEPTKNKYPTRFEFSIPIGRLSNEIIYSVLFSFSLKELKDTEPNTLYIDGKFSGFPQSLDLFKTPFYVLKKIELQELLSSDRFYLL